MSAIGPTVWKLVADPRKFTEGIAVTRRELAAARKVTEAMATPQEKYARQLKGLKILHDKGVVSTENYRRAQRRLHAEMQAMIPVTQRRLAGLGLDDVGEHIGEDGKGQGGGADASNEGEGEYRKDGKGTEEGAQEISYLID